MLALALASFLGISDFLGMGEKTEYFYYCSDPAFFVTRDAAAWSGDQSLVLKGTLNTPQPGYAYTMQFLGVDGPQARVVIQTGQPASNGNPNGAPNGHGGLPAVTKLQVQEKLNFITDAVGLLHVRIEGLTAEPWEFTCDLTRQELQE
jgi:hypothetical protein